jgi:apolipoprotein N-acyltransferase
MAPFFAFPVLWVTLPLLWHVIERSVAASSEPVARLAPWQASAAGRAAETAWWFGFGYHVAGLFWVGEAFRVEADVFGWLLPVAVLGLPAFLAVFLAAAAAATVAMAPPGAGAIRRIAAFAVAIGVAEWARGTILTGFPWNVLGYALTPPPMMQGAALLGIYGLTLLAVVVFAGPWAAWRAGYRHGALLLAVVPLVVLAAYRVPERLAYRAAGPAADAPRVRLVQPSIPQRDKGRPERQREFFDLHLALSQTAPDGRIDGAAGVDLIVWAEAAMPFLPLNEPVALAAIGRMLDGETVLASGALRLETAATGRRAVYNSLLLFGAGDQARLLAAYDKTHLVPFGEYLPFPDVLDAIGLETLTRQRGGFTPGREPRGAIDVPRVGRLAPLICYEAIFPARVVQTTERPRALLVVTNDGWFGDTTGPRQHLHMTRIRAVEEGLPVVRAANNGISAVIDAFGGIDETSGPVAGRLRTLALDARGTIDAHLPRPAEPPPYARFGDAIFWLLAGLGLVVVMVRRQFEGAGH